MRERERERELHEMIYTQENLSYSITYSDHSHTQLGLRAGGRAGGGAFTVSPNTRLEYHREDWSKRLSSYISD